LRRILEVRRSGSMAGGVELLWDPSMQQKANLCSDEEINKCSVQRDSDRKCGVVGSYT
jgi:hypothetical protein